MDFYRAQASGYMTIIFPDLRQLQQCPAIGRQSHGDAPYRGARRGKPLRQTVAANR
jgi:hypothetical protein